MILMACGSWNRDRDLACYARLEMGNDGNTNYSFRAAMYGDAKVVVVVVVMCCPSSVMQLCQASFDVEGVLMPSDMLAQQGC